MTSRSHKFDEVISNNYDEDGKPGDINVLEDILGGDDEVADEFDNELYKIETDDRKDKIEKNVKQISDSNKSEHRRSSHDDDRSLYRRTRPTTERSYKYEETKFRREHGTHSRRYELETSSSYYPKGRARDSKDSMQYSGRNKDRTEHSGSRHDIHGSKKGNSDNYVRSNSNYYRRGDSSSPKLKRSENERFGRSRRLDQSRYHDEYTGKKTQSRDKSYNYSGINDITHNDFRSSNNSNLQSVKRSSDSLHEKLVPAEAAKSKKRKAVDVERETDISHQQELKTGAAVPPHLSSQSVMLAATGNQSKRQSSLQHISKVEKRKDSPSSTYLPSTKILSSCDALSSDDDSEEFITIDSYGDSNVERENKNVVTRCLEKKEMKCNPITNDKLDAKIEAVESEKGEHETLHSSKSSTKFEINVKSEATFKDESTKKSGGLPFKICRSRFSDSSKDKADGNDIIKQGLSTQNRDVKQQSKKNLKYKEKVLGSKAAPDIRSVEFRSKEEKSHIKVFKDNITSNSSPYHIDASEADEREKLFQTLFCNTKFYVVKSDSYANVALSKKEGVWSTQLQNEENFNMAYRSGKNVVLIFSVNESKSWQGFALLKSGVTDNYDISSTLPAKVDPKGRCGVFKLQWLNRSELPFSSCRLRNSYNDDRPVNVSRDGQEIEPDVAKMLCNMFKHDPGIPISTLYSLVKVCSNRRRKYYQSRDDSDSKIQMKTLKTRKRLVESEDRSYTSRKRKADYEVYNERKAYQGTTFKSVPSPLLDGRNYNNSKVSRGRTYARNYKR